MKIYTLYGKTVKELVEIYKEHGYKYSLYKSKKELINGLLLKFSCSAETDKKTFGQMKFFSKNTNTIYPPKFEVRWDDHKFESSSKWNKSSQSGSLLPLSMSGHIDNYLYSNNVVVQPTVKWFQIYLYIFIL